MDDLVSRQVVIDALKNDMASLDHIIKGMSGNDVRLDAYVSQRNQVSYDIDTINNLPTAKPEPCEDCISRQAAIDDIRTMNPKDAQLDIKWVEMWLKQLPPAQPAQRTEALKAEIRRMKRSFTTCINSDYYTGYMSALSAVEGYIAQLEGVAE